MELKDYWNFSKDLYTHNIFNDKTIESIQDDYIWNKENDKNKNKGKDDSKLVCNHLFIIIFFLKYMVFPLFQ